MQASDPAVQRRAAPAARSAVIAAVIGAALLGLVGCSIEIDKRGGQREHESAKIAEAQRTGQVHFDLTGPPSRDEAGMPTGRSVVTYQADGQPIHTRVSLPGGEELAVDARIVTFDAMRSPDPATSPPTRLDITYDAPTLDAGRDHLLAAARQFGLETDAVHEWHAKATSSRPPQAPPTVRSRWIRTSVGYVSLEVRGSHSPPIDTPESARTSVSYLLTWDQEPTASPS